MTKKSKREELFRIISIGNKSDLPSRIFDIALVIVIICNLAVTLLSTFSYWDRYKGILDAIELITIILFTIEYILRILTADFLYPGKKRWLAALAFVFSISGAIDLLTFLPYYLPFFFPAGAVAFRMLRVIRIFRLFRVNAQYDAFNVILDVLNEKRNQLLFSIVLIFVFMIAASLCMYDLEHEAQPEAFKNAFSGIWWSVSTLLTVGYGDIYPVTTAGQVMAIIISFLGVGLVAIPTGIISAGFVQQYGKRRFLLANGSEHELQFVTSSIPAGHAWEGMRLQDIVLPPQSLIVLVVRNDENLQPKGDLTLCAGDLLVIAAGSYHDSEQMDLREVKVEEGNEWVGKEIRSLPLLTDEQVVMIKRNSRTIIPGEHTTIRSGDAVVLYNH